MTTHYLVLEQTSIRSLTIEVQAYLDNGWHCQGGVHSVGVAYQGPDRQNIAVVYLQALIKNVADD